MTDELTSVWLTRPAAWLTLRRVRAHAAVLALCLWGVCAVDYATPGLFDRAGNIKFQDFLQFPISAGLIAQGRAGQLYDREVLAHGIRATVGRPTSVELQYFYGPQVAGLFVPFVRLPFLIQAAIWSTLSVLIYLACIHRLQRICPALKEHGGTVALCAIAYPPLYHFFVRGQLSAVLVVCFTLAYLAFHQRRDWLAGVALGFLVFKPQFLVAIACVLILARSWKVLAGVALSSSGQLVLTYLRFGPAVMRSYASMLVHSVAQPGSTQLNLSATQMHSLRSFWELLLPWPTAVTAFFMISSLAVLVLAALVWRSSSPLALRFSALTLAAVLVNPHIYIYDLLAWAPVLLLLADWSITNIRHPFAPALRVLLYLSCMLPLFGPLTRWTHLQVSVVVFAALLWTLYRIAAAVVS